jgi:hypothetical protein
MKPQPALITRPAALAAVVLAAFAAFGCAFNIVSVKQTPTTLAPLSAAALDFTLTQDVTVPIGTGFPTRLKSGTRWHQVGIIDQGAVFTTRDQVVTVEASNIHEAQIVISNGQLVGFYLPVEHTFTSAKSPAILPTQSTKS